MNNKMSRIGIKYIFSFIAFVQVILVRISYALCCALFKKKTSAWVVVGVETASLPKNISTASPGALSVNFAPNKFI